jgi:tetratricopeptide (TPR) repeat protein
MKEFMLLILVVLAAQLGGCASGKYGAIGAMNDVYAEKPAGGPSTVPNRGVADLIAPTVRSDFCRERLGALALTSPGAASARAPKLAVAILDLEARGEGLGKGVADALSEAVRYEFSREESLDLVARDKMAEIAREKAIQLSGCTDVSCAVQIGKALNVQKMVTGSVVLLGDRYSLFVRLVDVEKEKVDCSERLDAGTRIDSLDRCVPRAVGLISGCMMAQRVREGVAQKPEDGTARYLLGTVLRKQEKLPEAEAAFREALRLSPDLPEARYELGALLAGQGKNSEAETELREVLRLRPTQAAAQHDLGVVLIRQGRYTEAAKAFEEAARLRSDDLVAGQGRAFALLAQGLFWESEKAFREVLRQKGSSEVYCGLGYALEAQNRLGDAESQFRQAQSLKYGFAEAHFGLGFALEKQKRFEEAGREYEEGLRLKPEYQQALSGLKSSGGGRRGKK